MKRLDISDEYFNRSAAVAKAAAKASRQVRYRVFSWQGGVLSGMNRAIEFVKESTSGRVRIHARRDGDPFEPNEAVMLLEGPYGELANLETTYLGMLSYSGGAGRMARLVKAAGGVPVVDMSARHYPPEVIQQVAYAAAVGGAVGTSTKAGCDYVHSRLGIGDEMIRVGDSPPRPFQLYGSIPHSLNAVYQGSSVESAVAYARRFPQIPLTVLIDFEGRELDVCREAYERLGDRLFAVRLDTDQGRLHQGGHETPVKELVDRIVAEADDPQAARAALQRYGFGGGVTIEAVYNVRACLDAVGASETRITVSSGFDEEKVAAFAACKAPMDAIGTGSWMDFMMFTSDVTAVFENGAWVARSKAGRPSGQPPAPSLPVVFDRP